MPHLCVDYQHSASAQGGQGGGTCTFSSLSMPSRPRCGLRVCDSRHCSVTTIVLRTTDEHMSDVTHHTPQPHHRE